MSQEKDYPGKRASGDTTLPKEIFPATLNCGQATGGNGQVGIFIELVSIDDPKKILHFGTSDIENTENLIKDLSQTLERMKAENQPHSNS